MKSRILVMFLPLLMAVLPLLNFHLPSIEEVEYENANPAIVDSLDITEDLKKAHARMPKPGTNFRTGHVKERVIQNYLSTRDGGFQIKLPKSGLTPSPTIYKDMVLVSGGFGSKEFYAFNAQNGKKIWAIDLDDDGPSSAVVENDIAVFNTESCTIFAVDVFTGKHLWSYYLGDPLMSTPSIKDGIVYTAYPANPIGGFNNLPPNANQVLQQQSYYPPNLSKSNSTPADSTFKSPVTLTHVLIAIELKTGKILWQQWIDGDVMSAPVIEDDELVVVSFPGTLYSFNAANGELKSAIKSRATSVPTVVGEAFYMTYRSDVSGEEAMESIGEYNRREPKLLRGQYKKKAPYLDEQVQSASQYKSAAASFDAGNGFSGGAPANSGWQSASVNIGQSNVSSLQAFQGSRILHLNGKNFNTMGNELICSVAESGKEEWKYEIKGEMEKEGGFLATPPLHINDHILIATLGGKILLINSSKGELVKEWDTGERIRYQPVVEKGKIYVSTLDGKVICIDTAMPELTGWPCWGANAAHTNKNS